MIASQDLNNCDDRSTGCGSKSFSIVNCFKSLPKMNKRTRTITTIKRGDSLNKIIKNCWVILSITALIIVLNLFNINNSTVLAANQHKQKSSAHNFGKILSPISSQQKRNTTLNNDNEKENIQKSQNIVSTSTMSLINSLTETASQNSDLLATTTPLSSSDLSRTTPAYTTTTSKTTPTTTTEATSTSSAAPSNQDRPTTRGAVDKSSSRVNNRQQSANNKDALEQVATSQSVSFSEPAMAASTNQEQQVSLLSLLLLLTSFLLILIHRLIRFLFRFDLSIEIFGFNFKSVPSLV